MRRSWEIYVGVFLVSAALLLLELTLTKVFSVILWYHFGFLAVSLALLGFGMGGIYHALRPERVVGGARDLVWRYALLAAVMVVVAFLFVTHSQFDTFAITKRKQEALVVFLVLELLAPFFFFGLCLSASITAYREEISWIYFANLSGSGAGCLLAIVTLNHMTGQQAVMGSAVLAAVGGLVFALRPVRWRRIGVGGLVTAGCLLLWWGPVSSALFELLPIGSKLLAVIPKQAIEYSDWSSLAKVDIFDYGRGPIGLWGLDEKKFKEEGGVLPERKGVLIDEWAVTSITRFDGDLTKLAFLEWMPATTVHRLRRNADMVSIGAGGGLDVLAGIYFGQRSITGVEINALIVEQVRTRYDHFAGHLYTRPEVVRGMVTPEGYRPEVQIVVAEGRHFLERQPDRSFDIIQLSGVDTHSTTEAGAFTLSENYLYTLEAFSTYFRKLREDGILTLTRWYFVTRKKPDVPKHGPRLFVLAHEALRRHGVEDPARCLVYLNSGNFTVLLLKVEPFAPEELRTIEDHAERYGFTLLFLPGRSIPTFRVRGYDVETPNVFEQYAAADDKERFIDDYPYDISPPTDERPFFFEVSRWRNIFEHDNFFNVLGGITPQGVLVILLAVLLLISFVFVGVPLHVMKRRGTVASGNVSTLVYFASLGLGYISIEIPLSQQFILFLGRPVYSLSVILFSILLASGVGSLISDRLGGDLRKKAFLAILLVAALGAATTLLLGGVFRSFLGLPLAARIAISVCFLAPVGLCMGIPFPLGVRLLKDSRPEAIAWAWAVNIYTSVLGSALSVVLGMAFGFRLVLGLAILTYLAGGLTLVLSRRAEARAPVPEPVKP